MGYLNGRIQTKKITLMHTLLSAFNRSFKVYFMTPLFATVVITEDEIQNCYSVNQRTV